MTAGGGDRRRRFRPGGESAGQRLRRLRHEQGRTFGNPPLPPEYTPPVPAPEPPAAEPEKPEDAGTHSKAWTPGVKFHRSSERPVAYQPKWQYLSFPNPSSYFTSAKT